MKKVVVLFSSLVLSIALVAQSIETGKNHYYYQRYTSAANSFHELLEKEPDNAEAWLWLVRSYISLDKTKEANDTLQHASSGIQNEPYLFIAKGYILLANKKADSAATYFTRAIDLTKGKNAAILESVADAHIDLDNGDGQQAVGFLEKAIKRDKNNAALYVKTGNAYLKMHNATEAYKAYKAALEKDKNQAEAAYRLGTIFLTQKNAELYLEHFNQAIAADKNYAPAYYELYRHYLYKDPAKAMGFFKEYSDRADKSLNQDYAYVDLLYLTKEYAKAIELGKKLLQTPDPQPRIFKLIAYSHAELKDSSAALSFMKQYFDTHADSLFIAKDYETMAELYAAQSAGDSTAAYYEKAIGVSTDSSTLYRYYEKLANLAKSAKNYAAQAKWLGRFYTGNEKASNIDLFNWGIAAFRANDFLQADSVFTLYKGKYPDQAFGYYWLARSNAAIDTAMAEGRAIPHYQKLIEVIGTDSLSATDKKWLTESYAYLAAYETNTEKDYKEAIDYFSKILEIDPANDNARKYIAMLEENLKNATNDAAK